jgi:hypothetical protein
MRVSPLTAHYSKDLTGSEKVVDRPTNLLGLRPIEALQMSAWTGRRSTDGRDRLPNQTRLLLIAGAILRGLKECSWSGLACCVRGSGRSRGCRTNRRRRGGLLPALGTSRSYFERVHKDRLTHTATPTGYRARRVGSYPGRSESNRLGSAEMGGKPWQGSHGVQRPSLLSPCHETRHKSHVSLCHLR